MSDIRFNQWLHQSGTGGVTQLSSGHVGIGTTNPLIPVHSGNNAVLNVGVVTANNIYAGTLNGTLALSDISGITGSFTSDLTVNGNLDTSDKIRHVGDTNTAIRFPANDTITFETGGYERLRIDSDGRFGVNTTNPDSTFRMDCAGSIRLGTGSYGSRLQFSRSGLGDELVIGVDGYGNSTSDEATIQSSINSPRPLVFATNNAERLRIHSSGAVMINTTNSSSRTLNLNGTFGILSTNQSGVIDMSVTDAGVASIGPYVAGGSSLILKTNSSGSGVAERFKIDSDGKFYKGGNQFYPLVNYVEVASFNGVSVSSNSYTDLRTIYSSYSPKKAGNRIVIHHQSQLWQGGNADGNGDAMWRIQKNEGSGWSTVIANERIIGNMDGRNYVGSSGLARHHRTVHLMGSFISNGNNFDLKSQGKVDHTNVSLQWYHHSENILQIWEYELA